MNVYIHKPVNYSDMQWPCASWFHVPTKDEWLSIYNIWTSLWWGSSDGTNFWISLKLPFSGARNWETWNIENQWEYCRQRCSTHSTNYADRGFWFWFWASLIFSIVEGYTSNWWSIRPFKDTPVEPTLSWTKLYWTNIESWWIFWNSSDWIISLSSDGTTWITISDKNLWATTVWNSWDTLSETNCGKYYQRWNNYWFAWTWATTKSSTKVNTIGYWPWNYYSSSTFITGVSSSYDWSSIQNDNLRWWVSWPFKINELKNAYIGEAPYEWNELCFTANTADSTVKLLKVWSPTAVTLETSTNGRNWSTYTFGDTITLSNVWDKVYWRNTSTTDTGFSTSWVDYYRFAMTWSIAWSWDINYLLNKNSTTSVSIQCYRAMFYWCTWLTTAPSLPATTLASNCYSSMFQNCTSLTNAPVLPATTLANYCYSSMFYWCTWLTSTPVLPATTLANYCYSDMLRGCTSLTTAPALPATTLSTYCYRTMFLGCTNLEGLPKLPATTLASNCYAYMFYQCSKIKLSTTQTWAYQTPYRIPTTWTGTTATDALIDMFTSTWWTFTWTPSINTTYYTSNTVI